MRRAAVLLAVLAAGCGATKTVVVTKTVRTIRTRTVTTAIQQGFPHNIPRVAYEFDLSAPDYGRLVPLDARVISGVVLGGEPPEIAVTFERDYASAQETALELWRDDAPAWRRIFLFRRIAVSDDYVRIVKTGDVTGDGRRDVLVFQDQDGSGGCGVWRLFADAGGRVRELSVRRGCTDTTWVTLEGPTLVDYEAVGSSKDPKTGTYIHCCWLRWTRVAFAWRGTSRSVVSRTVGPAPQRTYQ
jgi:hypothetical protein